MSVVIFRKLGVEILGYSKIDPTIKGKISDFIKNFSPLLGEIKNDVRNGISILADFIENDNVCINSDTESDLIKSFYKSEPFSLLEVFSRENNILLGSIFVFYDVVIDDKEPESLINCPFPNVLAI